MPTEVGIYIRKQESKKTRKQELDQESVQDKRKQERKQELDQESDQENKKIRKKKGLDQKKKIFFS